MRILLTLLFCLICSALNAQTYLYSYNDGKLGDYTYAEFGIDFKPMRLITGYGIFDTVPDPTHPLGWRYDTSYVSAAKCTKIAKTLKMKPITTETGEEKKELNERNRKNAGPICLDIEAFKFKEDPVQWANSTVQLKTAVKSYRAECDQRIGIYGMLPIRNFIAPVHWHRYRKDPAHPKHQSSKANYQQWLKLNRRHRVGPDGTHDGLSDQVDIIFPSLYPFNEKMADHLTYMKFNLFEGRKFDRPMIVWLWTQYHNSNQHIGGQYVGDEYLQAMIKQCVEMEVEGVVFFNGSNTNGAMPKSAMKIIKQAFDGS